MEEKPTQNLTDHDLLITLNVRVSDLIATIKDLKDTANRDIGALKEGKVDKEAFSAHCMSDSKDIESVKKELTTVWAKYDVHTANITVLNKYLWIGMGALSILQVVVPIILAKYFNTN